MFLFFTPLSLLSLTLLLIISFYLQFFTFFHCRSFSIIYTFNLLLRTLNTQLYTTSFSGFTFVFTFLVSRNNINRFRTSKTLQLSIYSAKLCFFFAEKNGTLYYDLCYFFDCNCMQEDILHSILSSCFVVIIYKCKQAQQKHPI